MPLRHLIRAFTTLTPTYPHTKSQRNPIHRFVMRPDIAIPYGQSAAVRANLHSSPCSPLRDTLEPEAFAHIVTELQDPSTKQGRKDTLLALLGLVREADDPASRAKPDAQVGEEQGGLEVDVEERASEVDSEGEAEVAEVDADPAEGAEEQSKRATYTITGETGRPCPRERLMG